MLVEYLYFDEQRLDKYLEQFSSPLHVDKFMQWKASLKLTGPEFGGDQFAFVRSLTKHEKVSGFCEFIVDQELVGGDPRQANGESFIDWNLDARRCFISEGDVAIWVSHMENDVEQDDRCRVFLIEDFGRTSPNTTGHFSAYSSLYILLDALEQAEKNVIGNANLDNLKNYDVAREFARDPFKFLEKLGAVLGPVQTIRTIFKVRTTAIEMEVAGGHVLGVVGYPIFIEQLF